MSNDDLTPGENHSSKDSGFVMPEHDGVNSGHPIESADQEGMTSESFSASPASTLRGRHSRDSNSRDSKSRSSGIQQASVSGAGGTTTQAMGWSIKNKLTGAFLLLTLLIAFLGYYSYSTLVELSNISLVVSKEQSQIAKLAEEIKTTVYKIRDAEKDFTYLEEQESLDRVTRYTAHIRTQLEEVTRLAEVLEKSTGKSIGAEFATIGELVETYESQFFHQVKSIKQARQDIDAQIKEITGFKKNLLSEIDKILVITDGVVGDYWINTKKIIANSSSVSKSSNNEGVVNNVELVNIGVLLSVLQQELLNAQIQTAKYFDTNKKSFADASRVFVNRSIALAKEIRTRTTDERVAQQMDNVGKNLVRYVGIFNEVTNNNDKVTQTKALIDAKIKSQLDNLKDTSDKLLSSAEVVSARSWGQVKVMGIDLADLSTSAQNNLSLLAILGTLIGIVVLVWIPRPILAGINQLLIGAQQVASGDLTQVVSVNSRDELGQLADTFERMRINLQGLVLRSKNASVQITSAVNEIQAAANQQSSTANEQASSINQFRATLSEMARTAGGLSGIVSDINNYAEKVSDHVRVSNDKSTQLLDSMGLIKDSTQQTSGRIKSLNDQMDSINDAVGVISVVADQTTLLSMNASIEANKAGEMGKGFSVVAYEIRRLSDRAIDSAGDITGKVRDIQRATENSVVAMDKSSEEIRTGIDRVQESTATLSNINDSLNTIRSQMGELSAGAQEQSVASTEAQQSVGELSESSKMVAVSAKETVKAAFEINIMANQLAESVATFRT